MIAPAIVVETNFSIAWAKTFLSLMEPSGHTRHPAVITVNGLENDELRESPEIRARIDEELLRHKKSSCATVAGTIFPFSMWNPNTVDDADVLYRPYQRAWERSPQCPANRSGDYV